MTALSQLRLLTLNQRENGEANLYRLEKGTVCCCTYSQFLSRVSILLLTHDIDIVILSVCLSVRDTLVLYENGLTYRHSFSTIR